MRTREYGPDAYLIDVAVTNLNEVGRVLRPHDGIQSR